MAKEWGSVVVVVDGARLSAVVCLWLLLRHMQAGADLDQTPRQQPSLWPVSFIHFTPSSSWSTRQHLAARHLTCYFWLSAASSKTNDGDGSSGSWLYNYWRRCSSSRCWASPCQETERSDQRHTPPEILLIMIVTEITINSQMASRNDDDDDDITNKI